MPNDNAAPVDKKVKKWTGGAVGAGLVLVVLPCIALFAGIEQIGRRPTIGLPILAVFGIMILFGALAITSTLFARLGLADGKQALALPEGSIRAAIALALIVLFAIISIMLYQSIAEPYKITGLSETDKAAIVRDLTNRVIAVVPEPCAEAASAPAPCAAANQRFAVHVRQPQGQESTDLAKQLLILIGTLMTSVTSFYFAARTADPGSGAKTPGPTAPVPAPSLAPPDSSAGHAEGGEPHDAHLDGCDVPIEDKTADEDLPAAKGGVAT